MRVVYLHQYFVTPEMSGGSRSYEMARRLVRAGYEVHMVTSDTRDTRDTRKRNPWTESVVEGINVHWAAVPYHNTMGYAGRLHAFFRFAWLAGRRAASLHGDVIFATSTPLTIALPGVYAARRTRCPMVFEVRDLWPAVPIAIGALRGPVAIGGARCGVLLDPRDPSSIAAALRWILDHPEEAEAMGERGRQAVQSTYNWDLEAAKLLNLYRRLMGPGSE